jgi:hypothetical protein
VSWGTLIMPPVDKYIAGYLFLMVGASTSILKWMRSKQEA